MNRRSDRQHRSALALPSVAIRSFGSAARGRSLSRESTCERDRPRQGKAAVPGSHGGSLLRGRSPALRAAQMHQFRSHGPSGARDRIRDEGAANEWRLQASEIRLQQEAARGRRPRRLQAAALLPARPFLAAGQARQRVDRHSSFTRRSGVIDTSDSRGYPAATRRVPSLPVDQAGAS